MFVVDTNVLVHASDEDSPFHAPCAAALARWRSQPDAWFVTWSVIYEFLRLVTHPRKMRRPVSLRAAWRIVDALLASPGLRVLVATPRHVEVARAVIEETPGLTGNLAHDAHIAVLMREHGVRRIYTRDADFFRFPFVEPIDPVRPFAPPGTAEPIARYRGAKRRGSARPRARP
jgi:toxin-antitoxin system PIN domain toxin